MIPTYALWDPVEDDLLFTYGAGLDSLFNKWSRWRVRKDDNVIYLLFEGFPMLEDTV